MFRRQDQITHCRFAGGDARIGIFNTVIQAVAHQVGQGVDDAFDQALVQFGRTALQLQLHLFIQFAGQIAHQPREAAEHVLHRHHADRHHRLLQVTRIAFQLAHAVEQVAVIHRIQAARTLRQHRLGDHQLTDQVN
ncbi:hypothetical protein D3C73_1228730 [compost metagenome]